MCVCVFVFVHVCFTEEVGMLTCKLLEDIAVGSPSDVLSLCLVCV